MPVRKQSKPAPHPDGRKVRDVMTEDVECVEPDTTVKDAAQKMRTLDIGAFPVCEGGDHVVGMVTDRDLTIRVLADARDANQTKVRDVMSHSPVTLSQEDDVEKAETVMEEKQLRRLPVVDASGKLVGLFSVGRVAKVEDDRRAGEVMKSVTQRRKTKVS